MIAWRALQVVAVLALLACLDLALKASPLGGEGWNPGRLLYAGSGMVTALTLFALAAIGIGQRRLADRLARIEQSLARRP
ncbi:hypothetical protein FK498_02435 [Elioraea sp. Yellowstone]|jgi:hypothetical protein|uniref:hypothetical protein n=1 Tax=Elioraea sp. Yellowstone TaxID=2592070 RepID=UPI001154D3F9|nr:hypothetical protein [Elioraea sp. Yellowstone]TQF83764.1 hypothetical protein FK498_02435 [Elioraea sp. Yellowstone]